MAYVFYKKNKSDLQYQVFQPDLPNLRGEKWKDIPGLEGYHMISNYGRVKRMEREKIKLILAVIIMIPPTVEVLTEGK